jgi:rubrerythrin
MGIDFNADEIFEIALYIEQNGAKFYRKAAESISGKYNKDLLLHLAEMEDEHEQTFKKLRSELSENEKISTTFDPEGEAELYLKALADTRVFYEKEFNKPTLKEIYKTAITAEKDSIVFYLGMKEVVPTHLGKEKLDEIIKEEMNHITLLSKELLEI